MLDGVAAVIFDEFHERSLDADLGLALARDVQQGLREDLRILVMSATIDGARIAALLGDAPVIASEGRAFPVETRYVGRDAQPIEPQVADTIIRAMRADAGSLLAFLPGAAEIRRTKTLLEGRTEPVDRRGCALRRPCRRRAGSRHCAGAARPPQDRAGDVDRRDLDHHRGRAHRRRLGLARVPRYEPDVGVTRLETVRVSRAAADQRRGRAGRIEPGVCYRLWDEPQTAALEPTPGRKSSPRICRPSRSTWRPGGPARTISPSSIRRRKPRSPKPRRCCRARRHRRRRPHHREGRTCGGCRCRRGSRAWWSMRGAAEGAALPAAEIAALIGERGLGGDDVDLRDRLASFAATARPARATRHGAALGGGAASPLRMRLPPPLWGRAGVGGGRIAMASTPARRLTTPTPNPSPQGGGEVRSVPGALLALAYPERIAKNRGGDRARFCWSTAAAPISTPPRRSRANRSSPSPSLPARPPRAVSCSPRRSPLPRSRRAFRPHRGARGGRLRCRERQLRGRRSRRLGAIALSDQPMPVAAER